MSKYKKGEGKLSMNIRHIFTRLILLLISFVLVGCMGWNYNEPKVSEPHAYIECIADEEHTATIFGDSSISILEINGIPTNYLRMSRIQPGKTILVVSEWYDTIFGFLKFNAKAGEKYIISSKTKRINNRFVSAEFILMTRGKIIQKTKGYIRTQSSPALPEHVMVDIINNSY